jgi:hypothetical protein
MKTKGQAAAVELNRQWPRLRAQMQPILKSLEQLGKDVLADQIRQTMAEIERTLKLWNDLQPPRRPVTPLPENPYPSA